MQIEAVPTADDVKAIKSELKRHGIKERDLEAALAAEVQAVCDFIDSFNGDVIYKQIATERDLPLLFHAQLLASQGDSGFARVAKGYRCGLRYALETRLEAICNAARRAAYSAPAEGVTEEGEQ